MKPGDRVLYIPSTGDNRPSRWGTIKAICGPSALIIFDDREWPQGAPLDRLHPASPGSDGWSQIQLFQEA